MGREYPDAPRPAVGAVVIHGGRVLLVRRRDAPNAGQWAIPGGSVHLGETLVAAAEREVLEETGVRVRAGRPIYAFDRVDRDDAHRVRHHYIIVDLLAEYVTGEPVPGDDALEARWLAPEDLAALPVNPVTLDLLRTAVDFLK